MGAYKKLEARAYGKVTQDGKMIMDIVGFTEKAIEMASKDDKLKENIKDTVANIVMELTDCKDTFLTFSINKGELKFFEGKAEHIDFQFEISRDDFIDLITGKKAGMILMATKKLKMVKGIFAEIGRIATPLGAVPKFGKEIAKEDPNY